MGFFSALGNIAKVASFIPGPHQPFTAGAAALSGLGGGGEEESGGGGISGALGTAGSLLSKYGGPALGIASLLQGQGRNREALAAQREGMNFARNAYDEVEPLRALAMSSLLGATPEAQDASGTFVDPTNPFASPSARQNLSLPAAPVST